MWYVAWQDGHVGVVPDALVRARSRAAFDQRVQDNLPRIRVAGPVGKPLGLCITREEQLHQLFVAAEARRSGLASRLLADAEARLKAEGVRRSWLKCAAGNERAAAFYRTRGWTVARTETSLFGQELGEGVPVVTWIFEKDL
nr:GNAT family N-acetyltransferase [Pseudoruegeria sp. HB172150]